MRVPGSRSILFLPLLYVVYASIWVLFSTPALARLTTDEDQLIRWEIYKGYFFILVTASLFFVLLLREKRANDRHIREIREAARVVQEGQERFQLLVESTQDYGIFLLDREGRVVSWNSGAQHISGYTAEEIIGQHFARFSPEEDRQAGKPNNTLSIAAEEGRFARADWSVRKDGSRFWAMTVITALYDEREEQRGFAVVTRDVNERKQYEERLLQQARELEELLKQKNEAFALLDTMMVTAPVGVAFFDNNLRYVRVNNVLAEINGLPIEAHIGRSVIEILPELGPEVEASLRQVLSSGQPIVDLEVKGTTPATRGKERYWQVTYYPLHSPQGEILGMGVIVSDITERKQADLQLRETLEKEKELRELKSRFVTTATHDFRTPLAVISITAASLEGYNESLSDEQRSAQFARIHAAVHEMSALIDDVLNYSRVDEGRWQLNRTPCVLETYCQTIVEQVGMTAPPETRIVFNSDRPCPRVMVDVRLLQQVLINLLSNAVKYGRAGSEVYFQVACTETSVIFSVRDKGIGIPERDRSKLFEPFFRASNVGSVEGSGLGLAIVKRALDLLGGKVELESEEGVGTTFTVTLPLVREEPPGS